MVANIKPDKVKFNKKKTCKVVVALSVTFTLIMKRRELKIKIMFLLSGNKDNFE